MSCWRVLDLSQPRDEREHIPQLLVKPDFRADSYAVHLTDLTNIWSEELDIDGILDRAAAEQSPIEASKQDLAQLALLLEHVRRSLERSDDAACRVTRSRDLDLVLHSVISLPAPLEAFNWRFNVTKRSPTVLKKELILPLLVSAYIQHERIDNLVSLISDKDRAITRFVDQFESSNMDLAVAFPTIGGSKTGRRLINREQAARYVPALSPFHEQAWRESTGQLPMSEATTIGLFQEALAQSTPYVPVQLKAAVDDHQGRWWTHLSDRLDNTKFVIKKSRVLTAMERSRPEPTSEETEDEFETHENFNTRSLRQRPAGTCNAGTPATSRGLLTDEAESTEEEDDDDLDILPKSQSQRPSQTLHAASSQDVHSSSPTPVQAPPEEVSVPSPKTSNKTFKIGGKVAKNPEMVSGLPRYNEQEQASASDNSTVPNSSQIESKIDTSPKKARRPFRIGGKAKHVADVEHGSGHTGFVLEASQPMRPLTANLPTSSRPPPTRAARESTPVEEVLEETAEEKAKRKRAELKRKNEEAAKKQAQQKKKKRF